jgi:hypothetical protein
MNKEQDYKIEGWWTSFQVDLVRDKSRTWQIEEFKPTAGIWIKTENGRLLRKVEQWEEVPKEDSVDLIAWDHEHCQLCWETISNIGDDQREGYTDGKDWVCISCYNTYIAPFINRNEENNAQY